jgi:hypothetical protein
MWCHWMLLKMGTIVFAHETGDEWAHLLRSLGIFWALRHIGEEPKKGAAWSEGCPGKASGLAQQAFLWQERVTGGSMRKSGMCSLEEQTAQQPLLP